mmetsp:Transcript_2443/g.6568  ORF Transcript_2443/g.6568 Transcript_2443/m.6568 type:complete len:264 (+) Transcript_2443:428-1219(+)
MRLPERFSSESWQSSRRSVPKCRAPSAPSSLQRRSRTRRVLFSTRKETSCLTPSSRIRCFPKRISLRCALTRSIRPRCTVCSSCRVWMRGFSRSQSRSRAPASSAAATATSTSTSSSASATSSSSRPVAARRSSTTARPPARPSGFCERSRRRSAGQRGSTRQSAWQPGGPMEFARSERLSSRSARGPSSPSASTAAPASVTRLQRRSRRVSSGKQPPRTFAKTLMSASPSRELNVSAWDPGASRKRLPELDSEDSRSERITR